MVGIGNLPFIQWFPQYGDLYQKCNTQAMQNLEDIKKKKEKVFQITDIPLFFLAILKT